MSGIREIGAGFGWAIQWIEECFFPAPSGVVGALQSQVYRSLNYNTILYFKK